MEPSLPMECRDNGNRSYMPEGCLATSRGSCNRQLSSDTTISAFLLDKYVLELDYFTAGIRGTISGMNLFTKLLGEINPSDDDHMT